MSQTVKVAPGQHHEATATYAIIEVIHGVSPESPVVVRGTRAEAIAVGNAVWDLGPMHLLQGVPAEEMVEPSGGEYVAEHGYFVGRGFVAYWQFEDAYKSGVYVEAVEVRDAEDVLFELYFDPAAPDDDAAPDETYAEYIAQFDTKPAKVTEPPGLKRVRINLRALTALDYSKAIWVPEEADHIALDHLVDQRYDEVDGGYYVDDPEYWERGHCTWEDDDMPATGNEPVYILDDDSGWTRAEPLHINEGGWADLNLDDNNWSEAEPA